VATTVIISSEEIIVEGEMAVISKVAKITLGENKKIINKKIKLFLRKIKLLIFIFSPDSNELIH
jgi:hypothetical protein